VTDPYGTAAIRSRVLAAWAASPTRFREDANAESDASRGDVVAELAQNALDAGARVLRLEVVDGVLYAANSGAPLDAAGVEALCHLRASTKSSGVGQYGIGFKAVLSVTSAPSIVTRSGGVAWSRSATLDAVRAVPSLAGEVARREGEVPVMRLPWPATADAHAAALLETYDTVVVLPLASPVDLGDVDETLLLTLPLDALVVDGREIRRDPGWVVRTDTGVVPESLLADRPVEERSRTGWSVTVAVPPGEWTDRRLRAPQPTGERVDVPVFLSVSVPLEPSRRHVVPGALTSWLVERAAESYVALLESLPHVPSTLDLLPSTLPAGPVDLALREALASLLPDARLLPGGVRGADAAVVDGSDALAEVLGVLPPAWLRRRRAVESLGVRVLETADVVDLLHGLDREPSWWGTLYAALDGARDPDALRGLPVPLSDGRVVTGPRGLLLPSEDVPAGDVGLRWVHPAACAVPGARAVLLAAGAEEPDPGAVLDALRDAVEASLDDEPPVEPEALYDVVLRLLARAPGAAPPWIGALALPSVDGDLRAADELLLPDGPLRRWVRDDSPFGVLSPSVVATYGADAVEAAGVLRTFSVVRDDLGPGGHDLDLEDEYDVPEPFEAVRDLEWVRDDAWPSVLPELPVLEGYTRWWLRRHPVVRCTDGAFRLPSEVASSSAPPVLASLYAAAGDPAAERLGLVASVDEMDDEALHDLASRIAERADLRQVRVLYAAVARRDVPLDVTQVRAVVDGSLVTVPVDEAYAVDRPDLLPLLAGLPWLPVDVSLATTLADVLGTRLASDLDVRLTSSPTATTRIEDTGVDVHDSLSVNGVRVAWSLAGRTPAVDGTPRGIARLTAWLQGSWPSRYAIEAGLTGARDDEALLDPYS
jgi:hypothetical protein